MSSVPKTALVTGCASGIGLATTQLFLSNGYKVFGVDISEFDKSKLEAQHISDFHFHKSDLTKDTACADTCKEMTTKLGSKIDVLCNVAGVMDGFGSADTLTDAEYDRVMAINLAVPIKLIRAALPHLKENGGGAIVNVASRAGISGAVSGIAYTASKHGLLGATKNVAWRFHKEGIRCNAVAPGGVATNIGDSMQTFNSANWDMVAYMNQVKVDSTIWPVHSLHLDGTPEAPIPPLTSLDIANAILFLASDQAKMINGVCLPVDRAWSTI